MDFDFTTETITPVTGTTLTISSTGAIVLPFGTTGQRPAGSSGYARYNTDLSALEFFNATGATWQTAGNTETNGISALSTTGLVTRTTTGTYTTRTITGTSNRITLSNGDGVAGNPTIDIDAAYVGQTSITTLGTITTGTWNGSTIDTTFGGTGNANGTIPLSKLTAAVASNSINNGDNAQTWNWALTTAAKTAFTFTENSAATNGVGAQYLVDISTIAASTANPIRIRAQAQNILTVTNVGVVTLQGADTGTTGQNITIRGGNSTTSTAGNLNLNAGNASGAGTGGSVSITAGTTSGGTAGAITLQTAGTTRLQITAAGSTVQGSGSALADSATNGFMYVANASLKPTGAYTAFTGSVPLVHTDGGGSASLWSEGNTSGASKWRPVASQCTRFSVRLQDDFRIASAVDNQIGELGWNLSSGSGTPTAAEVSSVADHPGQVQITTGATSGNNAMIHSAASATTPAASSIATEVAEYMWIVSIPTITSIIVKVGLASDNGDGAAATNGANGVWFEFSSAANANWRCYTRSGGTSSTALNTTVAVTAGNWYVLRAVRNSSTNWEFFVNDVSRGTIATNLPTVAVSFTASVQTATTAARSLTIDYFHTIEEVLGNRYT